MTSTFRDRELFRDKNSMKTYRARLAFTQNLALDSWSRFKTKIKHTWRSITDEDLDSSRGDLDRLGNTIQFKLGKARDEVDARLNQFSFDTDYSFENDRIKEELEARFRKAR